MKYKASAKQGEIFSFAGEDYSALICDGAVRSGKSSMMMIAFVIWAMENFNGCNFGVCGRAVQVAERNIIKPLLGVTSMRKRYGIKYLRSQSMLIVERESVVNWFYLFGGKDEASYTLIQGITLSGILFDEVALMPRSFVEQGITRTLSVDDAKLWFNCNPENPVHWFYEEWIKQPEKHNAKYLHFLMTDNPGLSPKAIERAANSFSGVFYDRYINGLWVKAEGLIYPQFSRDLHVIGGLHYPNVNEPETDSVVPLNGVWYMSIDYGTQNPFAALLWYVTGGKAYCMAEYYHDGRKGGARTDEEHAAKLIKMTAENMPKDRTIQQYFIDPSAASMRQTMARHGMVTRAANNDVVPGISNTATALHMKKLCFNGSCENAIREFGLYAWDEKAAEDKPIKDNDHAMDAVRYFCNSSVGRTLLRG